MDRQNCSASMGWQVVIVDGARACTHAAAGWRHAPACPSAPSSSPPPARPPRAAESHTLRTANAPPDAQHTEVVGRIAGAARRAIFLTGTPSLNRPFDLFRQVGWGGGCDACQALFATHGQA